LTLPKQPIFAINWVITNDKTITDGTLVDYIQVTVTNAALSYVSYKSDGSITTTPKGKKIKPYQILPQPQAILSRENFNQIMIHAMKSEPLEQYIDKLSITSSPTTDLEKVKKQILTFYNLIGKTDPNFPIVTPKPPKRK